VKRTYYDRRHAALTLLLLPLFYVTLQSAIDWAPASLVRDNFRRAYPAGAVRIETFRTTRFDTACGWYTVAGNARRWRWLQDEGGLTLEQGSAAWKRLGEATPEGADWETCMHHYRRGDPDFGNVVVLWAVLRR
jgi:hypothetical protein